MRKIFSSNLIIFISFILIVLVLALSVRGISGNPTDVDLNQNNWKENGPFELSPERGRFALTYSLIEDKSFYYSLPIARFSTPDLGFINGHYVSLFAPGVSFITAPGYIIGKSLGSSQVGTFSVIAFFALINLFLIRSIAINLGANKIASSIAAFVFLFATPAYAYAVNLYQHHISTFIILFCLYLLLKTKSNWVLGVIFMLAPLSIVVDYPNFFMMFPIGLFAISRMFQIEVNVYKISLALKLYLLPLLITASIPIIFFFWFNYHSYGNPMQFSGTVESVKEINDKGIPAVPKSKLIKPEKEAGDKKDQKNAVKFFQTRNLLQGIYTHLFSADRGIIFFTPVILFGLGGIFILYKKNKPFLALILGIMGTNFLLYSMWGDPWGGWAFGSRYMIPSYALLAILLAFVLAKAKKNLIILGLFYVILVYSIMVNTLGAITSSSNPPEHEIASLEKLSGKPQKYTSERNIDYLVQAGSKSFSYNKILRNYISAITFYWILVGTLSLLSLGILVRLYMLGRKENYAKY